MWDTNESTSELSVPGKKRKGNNQAEEPQLEVQSIKSGWYANSLVSSDQEEETNVLSNSCIFSVEVCNCNFDMDFVTGRGGDYTCWTHTMCLISCLARAWCRFLLMGPFRKDMGCWDRERFIELGMPSHNPLLSNEFRRTHQNPLMLNLLVRKRDKDNKLRCFFQIISVYFTNFCLYVSILKSMFKM